MLLYESYCTAARELVPGSESKGPRDFQSGVLKILQNKTRDLSMLILRPTVLTCLGQSSDT